MQESVILLVEDSPDDQALTARALKKNNIHNRLVIANDGAEALEFLLGAGPDPQSSKPLIPDLVLLDLHLPKVDGFEVLRRLRTDDRTRLLPVVILTSSNEDKDRINGYGLGANSYVRKPVDFGEFMDAVKQLGLYWLVLNVKPPVRTL